MKQRDQAPTIHPRYWRPNLLLGTRERARLILEKGDNHTLERVYLRKL